MLSMLRGPAGVPSRAWISPLERSTATIGRLEVGGNERERGATAAPGEGGWSERERERSGGGKELATVHVVSTSVRPEEVRGTLDCASGVDVVTPPTRRPTMLRLFASALVALALTGAALAALGGPARE